MSEKRSASDDVPPWAVMPAWFKRIAYGPTWQALLVLGPIFFIAPLLLAALVAYIHGTAPGGWAGFWWQH